MRSEADGRRPTLRWVLASGYVGLLVLALSILGLSVYGLVYGHLSRSGEYRLLRMVGEGMTDTFGPGDWRGEDSRFKAPRDIMARAEDLARAGVVVEPRAFAQVYSAEGALVASAAPRRFREPVTAPDSRLVASLLPLSDKQRSFLVGPGRRQWQVVLVNLNGPSGVEATVAVGLPWDYSQELLDALASYFVFAGLATIVLAIFLSRWLAARLSRPLEVLTAAAEQVAGGDLTARAGTPAGTLEAARLALSFDGMVRRVEQSLEAQKRFIADASHELKTPLTALGGMLEMLRRGADKNPQDRELAISTMEREVERMSRLVADLLSLSRAEQRVTSEGMLSLSGLLEETATYLRLKAMEHRVEVQCPPGLVIKAPQEALERVLRNLVNNSAKYTQPGKLIKITAETAGQDVRIVVEDEGIGIASEDLERVFDRFYRADPARSRGTGGTGLGLPIARALVESMHGSLHLESKLGRGTRAIVTLPARPARRSSDQSDL